MRSLLTHYLTSQGLFRCVVQESIAVTYRLVFVPVVLVLYEGKWCNRRDDGDRVAEKRSWDGTEKNRQEREEKTDRQVEGMDRFMEKGTVVCCRPRVIKVANEATDLMGWRNTVIGSLLWWSAVAWQLAFSPPFHSIHTLRFYATLVDWCVCVKIQRRDCKPPAAA